MSSSYALFFSTSTLGLIDLCSKTLNSPEIWLGGHSWAGRRTDWLSSMEHLRIWAHTATTLCRYSGPDPPGGLGVKIMARPGGIGMGWFGGGS